MVRTFCGGGDCRTTKLIPGFRTYSFKTIMMWAQGNPCGKMGDPMGNLDGQPAGRRVRLHVGTVRWGRDLAHLHNTSTGVLTCAYDEHMTTELMGYVDGFLRRHREIGWDSDESRSLGPGLPCQPAI
jgi:hypothetical protein